MYGLWTEKENLLEYIIDLVSIYEMCLKTTSTKAVFTKIVMNNELNINYIQNTGWIKKKYQDCGI